MRRATIRAFNDLYIYSANAPTVNNDETQSLRKGQRWIHTAVTPQEEYVLLDASAGAADWENTTVSKDSTLTSPTIGGTPLGKLAYDPGSKAHNYLSLAAVVVSAQKVTIGADVYEIEIVNTDSTDNTASGHFNNVTSPLTVATFASAYTHITMTVGKLLRIQNEIMRCTASSGASRTFARGVSGTTIATHANALDMYVGDGIAGGSTIAVGLVTALTGADFGAALVDDLNTVGTETDIEAELVDAQDVLLKGVLVGELDTACTATLTGGNDFLAATMYGGRDQAVKKHVVQQRVPSAAEVAAGIMFFAFDWDLSDDAIIDVKVTDTDTPGLPVLWDGTRTIGPDGDWVRLDDDGSENLTTSLTVTLTVID